jgi:hypothetical protein
VEQGGGLTVAFALKSGTDLGNFGTVTNNGEGTYSVTLTATTAGKNTITAKIGGKAVTSALPTITVTPPPGSAPPPPPMMLAAADIAGDGMSTSLTEDADSYGIHDAALLALYGARLDEQRL